MLTRAWTRLGGASRDAAREARGKVLPRAEKAIYGGVAAVLVGLALAIFAWALAEFADRLGLVNLAGALNFEELRTASVNLLSAMLLVLMLVEILHTIGISLRERVLVPEPFLIVGLIAAIRRVLVLTAEQGFPTEEQATSFRLAMLELGLLVLLVVGFVVGLILLARARRQYGGIEGTERYGGGGAGETSGKTNGTGQAREDA